MCYAGAAPPHRFWSDDWVLSRNLALARTRLLIAQVFVLHVDDASTHAPLQRSASSSPPADTPEITARRLPYDLVCCITQQLPSAELPDCAPDNPVVTKLKRRRSSRKCGMPERATPQQEQSLDQQLRAATFSQKPARERNALVHAVNEATTVTAMLLASSSAL